MKLDENSLDFIILLPFLFYKQFKYLGEKYPLFSFILKVCDLV